MSLSYSSPYKKAVWFYEKSDVELIRRTINEFDWIQYLPNVGVDQEVCYFAKVLLNIIYNFTPHERIICDDRDPPWIYDEIKKTINEKNSAHKSYCRFNRDEFLFENFKVLQHQ